MSDDQSTLLKFMYTLGLFGGGDEVGISITDYDENSQTPEVVLDFVNEFYAKGGVAQSAYSDVATFARASTATYFNSSGVLTSASSGTPRIGSYLYSGAAWVNKGLMLESEARTNLFTYSEALSNWTIANTDSLTVTDAQSTAFVNMNLARVQITDTTSETKHLTLGPAISANTDYCLSGIFKDDDQRYVGLKFYGTVNHWATATFDLVNETIDAQTGAVSGTINNTGIIEIASGIFLCWMTSQVANVTDPQIGITFANTGSPVLTGGGSQSYAGTAGVGLWCGGFQIEAGSLPSSYIPTSGATATRAAETLTIAAANTTPGTTAISLHIKGNISYADEGSAAQQTFVRWQSDANNYVSLDLDTDGASTGEVNANQNVASTLDTVVAAAEYSPAIEVAFNISSRHTSGAINVAKDGTAATADTTPTALVDLDAVDLNVAYDMMGHVDLFRVWETADIGDAGIASASS